MSRDSFYCILDLIGDHSVFHNNSPKPQAAVFVQLAVALDRFGHEGNGACLDRSMLLWGISHGSMVNYTNRGGPDCTASISRTALSAVCVVCKTAINRSVCQSAVNCCVPIERDESRRIVNSRIRDRMRPFVVVLIIVRDGPQAGALLHFELYTEEDEDNYMRWKWISKEEAHRVLRGIDAALL
ncbi:hypothetical protein R1sor_021977 [Riccia sorocarpa]|uniref:Nudix hydrolase domain-containing protein n=1 Tax=Riccia sorocarpa TaxID=122646 RepID=A0ABD3GK85_9MARC